MKMTALTVAAVVCAAALTAQAELRHLFVAPDVTTEGSGDGWANAMSLTNALAKCTQDGDTIYLKAGTYALAKGLSTTHAINIRGGFAGLSGTSLDLADNPVSVLDGQNLSAVGTVLTVTAASGTFTAERLDLRRGYQRGFKLSGGISAALTNCVVTLNAWGNTGEGLLGRGLHLTGTSTATVTLSGCLVATNVVRASRAYQGDESGCGLYAMTFKRLTLADTTFLRNGIDGTGTGRDKTIAGGIYISGAPVTATGCRFLNNSGEVHSSKALGAMLLTGASGGSSFVNCLWSKTSMSTYSGNGGAGSVFTVSLSAKAQTILFDRCTFAYNTISCGANRTGALYVTAGTATVRNCIVWGNASSSECDFTVGTSGVLKLDNTIIGGTGSANVNVLTGGSFTPGSNILSDPLFATDATAAKSLTGDKIDFHVHSTVGRYLNGEWVQDEDHSPAIDAAMEGTDYSLEPMPNGGVANLGFYGGTAQASKSVTVVPTVTAVAAQNDYTRPSFDITLGGNADYRAAVWLCLGKTASAGEGTNGWESVILVSGSAARGDTVTGQAPTYYDTGDTIHYRAVLIRGGVAAATADGSVTLVNDPPPFRGKGGGETIIHLRAGAVGNGTGTNWEHAVSTLAAALKLLSSAKNEIWVAGTCPLGGTTSATRTFTLRGGFAGTECAASERSEGSVSVLTGQGSSASPGLAVAASSGTFVAERIEFFNAYTHGLSLTGGASAALTNCCFRQNAWNNTGTKIQGRGAYFTGSSSASLTFAGCSFLTNVLKCSGSTGCESGCGLYAKTFRRITMDDTDFIWNGTCVSSSGRDSTKGAGIYIESAPVTARRCRFLGLWGMTHNAGSDGGAMYLCGSCGGSAFTNCLWAGSSFRSYSGVCANAGALWLALSAKAQAVGFERCTFAANYACGSSGGALMVSTGTANVRNSIFWGNFKYSGQASSVRDVYVGGTAVVNLDHCLQKQTGGDYTLTASGGTLNLTSMVTNSPLFADAPATAAAMTARRPDGMDFHVHSVEGRYANGAWVQDEDHSPAIDAATSDADWSLEPAPNGSLANLGFYGGTAQASMSRPAVPEVTGVAVTQPDYTRPTFAITLGGEGDYHVAVYLGLGTTAGSSGGTNGWERVVLVSDYAGNGETVVGRAPCYYAKGDTVYWNAVAIAADGTQYPKTGETAITGENPPFRGHGGGAKIIHLREDAAGRLDGSDWEHAVATFADAVALLSDAKTEIWVAGTCPLGTYEAPTVAATVRGGFTGTEDRQADRAAGATSTLDGEGTADGLWFGATVGENSVERLVVTRSLRNGIRSTGGADLRLVDSRLEGNGREVASGVGMNGRGLYFTGDGGTTLFVSNCQISANRALNSGDDDKNNIGQGVYLAGLRRALFFDTTIASNGCGIASAASRSYARGAALYTTAPVSMTRCRVVGHGSCAHGWYVGGIVVLDPGAGGSTFTNCLFMGNAANGHLGDFSNYGSGALIVSVGSAESVDLANCTFAFNISYGATAGLYAKSGTTRVSECLFWGNLNGYGGADISQAGSLTLSRCLFGGTNAAHLAISSATRAAMEKCVTGDPLLVSTTNDLSAALTAGAFSKLPVLVAGAHFRSEAAACGFNVHVRGRNGYDDETTGACVTYPNVAASPALDAGGLGARQEPQPNRLRRNLGYYGGTRWATRSAPAGMAVYAR